MEDESQVVVYHEDGTTDWLATHQLRAEFNNEYNTRRRLCIEINEATRRLRDVLREADELGIDLFPSKEQDV